MVITSLEHINTRWIKAYCWEQSCGLGVLGGWYDAVLPVSMTWEIVFFFFLGACVVKAWHKICHFFSKTFSSPRVETLYPLSINSLFLLSPGPGNFSSTFCFWIRLSRCLIWVESQEICPFVSGLFHFVCSGFIRVVAWIITSFFYKDGWVIFHYMDKTTFCLFIHLLMGTWVASTFWLLLMLLLWTSGY